MISFVGNQELTRIYSSRDFELGVEVKDGSGRTYRFIKYNSGAGTVTAVAGRVGYFVGAGTTAREPYEVTMDHDSNAAATAIVPMDVTTTTVPSMPAGCFQAALTDGTYGFIQTKGPNRLDMLTGGSVTVGDDLVCGDGDGLTVSLADAAPPQRRFGTALYNDGRTTATVLDAGDAMLDFPY